MSSVSAVRERAAENLLKILGTLRAKRDAEIEKVREQYRSEIEPIEQALTALTGSSPPTDADIPRVTPLHIGDDKLDAIRQYVKTHSPARQADIAKALELNTGTVSVGLRKLHEELHEIEPGKLQRGSRLWQDASAHSRRIRAV